MMKFLKDTRPDPDDVLRQLEGLRRIACSTQKQREVFNHAVDPVIEFISSEDGSGTVLEELIDRIKSYEACFSPQVCQTLVSKLEKCRLKSV